MSPSPPLGYVDAWMLVIRSLLRVGSCAVVGLALSACGRADSLGSSTVEDRLEGDRPWKLQADLSRPLDVFGTDVAIAGETLVVGAPSHDAPGAALVFAWGTAGWEQQAKLKASEPQNDDSFGTSVAVDGDRIVVGAPADESSGSVYVFDRTGSVWSSPVRLDASGRTGGDDFGRDVAVSGDTVVVGAPSDNEQDALAGAAYVFTFDDTEWQGTKLLASGADSKQYDQFGTAVALDGNTAVVTSMGGPGDVGTAFVYARAAATWTEQTQLHSSSPLQGEYFGQSVSVSDGAILVGAPGHSYDGSGDPDGIAYEFRLAEGAWVTHEIAPPEPVLFARFGDKVALDGDLAAVVAPADGLGALYLFGRTGDSWAEVTKLTDQDGMPSNGWGTTVSASGQTVTIGFPDPNYPSHVAVFARPDGVPCDAPEACASRYCARGLCCEQACNGACESCRGADRPGGTDGICGPVAAGMDPNDACDESPVPGCGQTGQCDGDGSCARIPAGTACGAASCAAGRATPAPTCTETGDCKQQRERSCAGFVCGGLACLAGCTDDSACDQDRGFICQDGKCKLPPGAPCTHAADCPLGFCVDGVCCDSECTGECEACTRRLKSRGVDGECGPVKADTDPDHECKADPSKLQCGADGRCDGKRHCRSYASAGSSCGPSTCTGEGVQGYTCDGGGQCDDAVRDCSPYLCADGACRSSCEADDDCAESAFCAPGGTCEPKRPGGERCAGPEECDTGFCADGVCCNKACEGQCEACDTENAPGVCIPVVGSPQGSRPQCENNAGGEPCQQAACDGHSRSACRGFVSGNACELSDCPDAGSGPRSTCNGAGACECAQGLKCSDDGTTLLGGDPPERDCTPYRCFANDCATSCSASSECQAGFACNPTNLRCESVRPAVAGQGSGCAIGAPRGRGEGAGVVFVLLCAGLARRKLNARRRQRAARID